MATKYNQSERQISSTFQLLESWECLNHLSENDKERIKLELELIKNSTISDIKHTINQIEL